jgi:predicted RNA methylase
MRARNQGLHTDNLQELLDSASNAANKGAQQFFTPPDIAAALASPLPKYRRAIVDFNCGSGALLVAGMNYSTENLLGIDIDPRARVKIPPPVIAAGEKPSDDLLTRKARAHVITSDVQAVYPLLREIDWKADLILCNPPFSLKWDPKRLECLAESTCEEVAEIFAKYKNKPAIDSTLASFLIALDALSQRGEGYFVCTAAAAERLILSESALRAHVWLRLTTPNFFADVGKRQAMDNKAPTLMLSVLYFTRGRQTKTRELQAADATAASISAALIIAEAERDTWRGGYSVSPHHAEADTAPLFKIAKLEHEARTGQKQINRDYNIWLDMQGSIRRYLTAFQNMSCKVPRQDVKDLDAINGQSPMALVVQKSTRLALTRAVRGKVWRVQPELMQAVEKALRDYDSIRAPFYPLNEVQRLGYLDEEDFIECKVNFSFGEEDAKPEVCFVKGERYALTSRTVPVERHTTRANLTGELEEIEITGQELSLEITDCFGFKHAFTHDPENSDMKEAGAVVSSVHGLEKLLEHFVIPPVPDIASTRPEDYQRHIAQLGAIEAELAEVNPS